MGIRYGSDKSVRFVDGLYETIASEAYAASAELAAEKGSFPLFDPAQFLRSGYMESMPESVRESVAAKGMRNVTLLTQAPNGTIGTMVG
ncbi:MAG: adenosylcobalamin-dependent ribonucleoside-diphosphate reductase, partial [Blastocatellia bacterium]